MNVLPESTLASRRHRVRTLHAQGMSDSQISRVTGYARKSVGVIRKSMGLEPINAAIPRAFPAAPPAVCVTSGSAPPGTIPISVESVTGDRFVLVASRVCKCGARSYSGRCPHCETRLS
jgi:hypothetical protein